MSLLLQSELLSLLHRRDCTFGSHILHQGFFSMVPALKCVPDPTGCTTQFGLGPLVAFIPCDPTELQRFQQCRDNLSLAVSALYYILGEVLCRLLHSVQ
jgi:hypothetical protein